MSMIKQGNSPTQKVIKKSGITKCADCGEMYLAEHEECPFCSDNKVDVNKKK